MGKIGALTTAPTVYDPLLETTDLAELEPDLATAGDSIHHDSTVPPLWRFTRSPSPQTTSRIITMQTRTLGKIISIYHTTP